MDYDRDTRNAYRNEFKAKEYQEQYTKGTKWARFTMWRQKALVAKIIKQCELTKTSTILDIPCGTGFIGRLLSKTPAVIVASDISTEMMERARKEYVGKNFAGFVQCDITKPPFRKKSFDCVILLAFVHRLPKEIRHTTWENIVELSKRFVIVNYSVDSRSQRLKQRFLKAVRPNYIPAPSWLSIEDIVREVESFNMVVRKIVHIAYFFSGKVLLLLEENVPSDVILSNDQRGEFREDSNCMPK